MSRYTEITRRAVREQVRKGESASTVAKRYGISQQTVHNWLKAASRSEVRPITVIATGSTQPQPDTIPRLERFIGRLVLQQNGFNFTG